jgi:phosphoribosylamine---glycine ligase
MPHVSSVQIDTIMATAVEPLLTTLRNRGIDYRGVLYAGLMLGDDGPKVIEYNVRFGDPETQVVLPLLSCDAAELFMAVATGTLARIPRPTFSSEAAVCVVLASPGYPESPRTGDAIAGLDASGQSIAPIDGVTVFHAGTSRPDPRGPFLTSGGRVLGVTALAPTLSAARTKAYAALEPIRWDGMLVRSDIAARAVAVSAPAAAAPDETNDDVKEFVR